MNVCGVWTLDRGKPKKNIAQNLLIISYIYETDIIINVSDISSRIFHYYSHQYILVVLCRLSLLLAHTANRIHRDRDKIPNRILQKLQLYIQVSIGTRNYRVCELVLACGCQHRLLREFQQINFRILAHSFLFAIIDVLFAQFESTNKPQTIHIFAVIHLIASNLCAARVLFTKPQEKHSIATKQSRSFGTVSVREKQETNESKCFVRRNKK